MLPDKKDSKGCGHFSVISNFYQDGIEDTRLIAYGGS